MFETLSSRPVAIPALATVAAAVTLTPVTASTANPTISPASVSLRSAAAPGDAESILAAAAPEALASDDSGVVAFIEGIEQLLHYPLALVEWPIGFVPIAGGVVNGVLEAFWGLGVDLVNAPLIPTAEVLTGAIGLGEGLSDFGERFVGAFTDFVGNLFGSVEGLLPPTPFAAELSADPSELAAALDVSADAGATDALDPAAVFDLF
jgi:hypothetical protein